MQSAGAAEAKTSKFVHVHEALDALLLDGRIDIEENSVYQAGDMQAARFVAHSHASRVKMSNHITLFAATETEGHLAALVDGRSLDHDVTSGMLYFVPENIDQEYVFEGTSRNTLITLDASLIRRIKDENPEFRAAPTDEPRFPFRNPRLARKMTTLIALAAKQDMGWRSMTDACNTQIAVELLKSLCNGTERMARPLVRVELTVVQDYVRANLEHNIGLEDVSALLQRDIYGFGRAFKSATGMTFHQYVTQSRVDEARRLLTETKMPLIEVAYACGFSSQAHLTTVMGRHVGLTPGALRQQLGA